MRNIVVLNGPNLNLLGIREPEVYGYTTLAELQTKVIAWGTDHGLSVETFQSNHEGEIIDRLHQAASYADGVVLNAGALTHYSYALHDAIAAIDIPTVEVHLSNVHAREQWRRVSVIEAACVYSIFGRGLPGYRDALRHLVWRAAGPPRTISYGKEPDRVGDLRVPESADRHPVAVILHGGFWRDVWTRDLMDGIAVDLTARGWATWNVEFRRVGLGGGWPMTFDDVAGAFDALGDLADEHALDLDRVVAVGHSAGGHLALWAAARPGFGPGVPGADPEVTVGGVVATAPVSDLAFAAEHAVGGRAVQDLLAAGGEYPDVSPAAMVPLGVPQAIVHGTDDDVVPAAMSAAYSGAAADAGDAVVYHELAGTGHYEVLDPSSEAWGVVAAELERLRGGS